MTGDRICVDGRIVPQASAFVDMDAILSFNYTYQDIHAYKGAALAVGSHVNAACDSYYAIHGTRPHVDSDRVRESAGELVKENRYRAASVMLRLYLMPGSWLLTCLRPMLYEGLVLWHSRPEAISVQYETPFCGHMCAVGLHSASCMENLAKSRGCDAVIHESCDGLLLDSCDNPVAAVTAGKVLITPLDYGAVNNPYRELIFSACKQARIGISEQPLGRSVPYDEMMLFTPQGITGLRRYNGRPLSHTVTSRLTDTLPYLLNSLL